MSNRLTLELPFAPGTEVYFRNGSEIQKGAIWQYRYESYLWATVSVSKHKVVTVRADLLEISEEELLNKEKTSEKIVAKDLDRIGVSTVFGEIVAEKSTDPECPGIYLSLIEEGSGIDYTLALVEATPEVHNKNSHALRLLAWGDMGEEYTDVFFFKAKNGSEE